MEMSPSELKTNFLNAHAPTRYCPLYHYHLHVVFSTIVSSSPLPSNQGWHGTFYPLGKTGWVKLVKSG